MGHRIVIVKASCTRMRPGKDLGKRNKTDLAKIKKTSASQVMWKCTPGLNCSINVGEARLCLESGGLLEAEIQLS